MLIGGPHPCLGLPLQPLVLDSCLGCCQVAPPPDPQTALSSLVPSPNTYAFTQQGAGFHFEMKDRRLALASIGAASPPPLKESMAVTMTGTSSKRPLLRDQVAYAQKGCRSGTSTHTTALAGWLAVLVLSKTGPGCCFPLWINPLPLCRNLRRYDGPKLDHCARGVHKGLKPERGDRRANAIMAHGLADKQKSGYGLWEAALKIF